VKKCIDFEVEGVRPTVGLAKENLDWGHRRKRLSDPTNMQGRCCGP